MHSAENAMKVPFTVSARAARLIGRENVATAEVALVELVKNSYDADAKNCFVYFDNRLANYFDRIATAEFSQILEIVPDPALFRTSYALDEAGTEYSLIEIAEEPRDILREQLMRLARLWIIDDGIGMDQSVIRNHWMVIGTDTKEIDAVSRGGRIKAGAKGIGRFALDRLGRTCTMVTKPNSRKAPTYQWNVSWEEFEGRGKLIDNVTANLTTLKKVELLKNLNFPRVIPNVINSLITSNAFQHGTIIEIGGLPDAWTTKAIEGLYSHLETLIPPRDQDDFKIHLFTTQHPDAFGIVATSICDDYDYKIQASFTADQTGTVKIFRNEIDLEKLDQNLFKRPSMKGFPYDQKTFQKGAFEKKVASAPF